MANDGLCDDHFVGGYSKAIAILLLLEMRCVCSGLGAMKRMI